MASGTHVSVLANHDHNPHHTIFAKSVGERRGGKITCSILHPGIQPLFAPLPLCLSAITIVLSDRGIISAGPRLPPSRVSGLHVLLIIVVAFWAMCTEQVSVISVDTKRSIRIELVST